jgi:hypothetical protein
VDFTIEGMQLHEQTHTFENLFQLKNSSPAKELICINWIREVGFKCDVSLHIHSREFGVWRNLKLSIGYGLQIFSWN